MGALAAGVGILGGARAAVARSGPRKILVVGDSLSAEYGLERGAGWVNLIDRRLGQQFPEYQIHNSSISGDTTSGGLSRFPSLLREHQPDIVILELGGNDALRGLSLQMTRGNLDQMIQLAEKAGAQVLLVGMQIPPNYGKRYTESFKTLFPELAQENKVGLVPFLLEGIATEPGYFQADGIHPNESAQPLLAENVWAHLGPMLAN
ncbi:MAG: arylesterase [Burkholderiaceae bacterium]|jgi:acyl-CoA thioesterase-1